MRILVVDNHDSFTWNLVHAFRESGAAVEVVLNDRALPAAALAGVQALVISPGPGRPEEAGICLSLIREALGALPLLGVCLGHQALAVAHGARIVRAGRLMHGKTSPIRHDAQGLFRGLRQGFPAMRYHSLAVAPESVGDDLVVTARADDGAIMALAHRRLPAWGVQFHPESIGTPDGRALLDNFLTLSAAWQAGAPRAA